MYNNINFIFKRPTYQFCIIECVEFELPVWTGSKRSGHLKVICEPAAMMLWECDFTLQCILKSLTCPDQFILIRFVFLLHITVVICRLETSIMICTNGRQKKTRGILTTFRDKCVPSCTCINSPAGKTYNSQFDELCINQFASEAVCTCTRTNFTH